MLNDDLTAEQKHTLLKVARDSIIHFIANKKQLIIPTIDQQLCVAQSCFITLKLNGKVRGCMGQFAPGGPLINCVRDMAIFAALKDKRYPPVTLQEIDQIDIEISLLSPIKRCHSAEDFELGVHGVIVRGYGKVGVFLPHIARKTKWSREQFLQNLCLKKAKLEAQAYKDPNVKLYKFEMYSFKEEKARQ